MLIPDYTPLNVLLAKEGKNKTYLRENLKISSSTLAKMSKNEEVAMSVLLKICDHFDCQIQDVVQFIRVEDEENEDKSDEA